MARKQKSRLLNIRFIVEIFTERSKDLEVIKSGSFYYIKNTKTDKSMYVDMNVFTRRKRSIQVAYLCDAILAEFIEQIKKKNPHRELETE